METSPEQSSLPPWAAHIDTEPQVQPLCSMRWTRVLMDGLIV